MGIEFLCTESPAVHPGGFGVMEGEVRGSGDWDAMDEASLAGRQEGGPGRRQDQGVRTHTPEI